jgi:hypothetical protein
MLACWSSHGVIGLRTYELIPELEVSAYLSEISLVT